MPTVYTIQENKIKNKTCFHGEEQSLFNETIMTLFLLLIRLGFVLLFFGGGGGYALFLGLSDKKKAAASKDWRSVPGKIVSSQINEVTHHDSDGAHRGLMLDAEYEYTVDGVPYLNNKHTPGSSPLCDYNSETTPPHNLVVRAEGEKDVSRAKWQVFHRGFGSRS